MTASIQQRARYLRAGEIQVSDGPRTGPEIGEVQVRVAFAGICGTDLHLFHGQMGSRLPEVAIFGHEMSGTIASIGEGVTGWSIGQPVTVMPLQWDGTCPACLAGNQHICQNLDFMGIDSAGALQEYWNVPAEVLVALPPELSLRHGALVEPVAVAVHDVRRAQIAVGDRTVVIGGGPIGVLIALVARNAGAEVVLVEPDGSRRAIATGLGIRTLDPRAVDQVAWVEDWTGGAGADAVFEVSGSAAALLGATSLLRVRGRLVVVAIHSTPREVDLFRVFWRELQILGARVYERTDFEAAADLLAAGAIPADALITDTLPLPRLADALATLESGGAMKILIAVERSDDA
ncbi:alcohol dehydrogenase catalytic domain-containing protein [soil metagenome]